MIGHAVAGLPGASFVMPEPSAAAVTGYGGSGGAIANGAGADATNGAPNEVAAAVSETAFGNGRPCGRPTPGWSSIPGDHDRGPGRRGNLRRSAAEPGAQRRTG